MISSIFNNGQHEPHNPEGLGIAVLGYNRPDHLESVLESLNRQGHSDKVHVWIDGTQGRREFQNASTASVEVAHRYSIREHNIINGHLGIEKMMLDVLGSMCVRYDRVILLEDDCFPVYGCIEAFETTLNEIVDRPDVYSAYGCHFGTEPEDDRDFTRFQGWGWAAHSKQIMKYLPELRDLFMMTETAYLQHVADTMTDEIRARLDRTPGRNVLNVLQSFFSWDSATAFLSARYGLTHRRTQDAVVINTGIVPETGHFCSDTLFLRNKPFNMITLNEAWARFDTSSIRSG